MKNQVLSIEQMRKLKELGVDTSKASMAVYNIYAGEQKEYDILAANGAFAEKQEHDRFGYGIHNVVSFDKKTVFTLQDIIELLPKKIRDFELNWYMNIMIIRYDYYNSFDGIDVLNGSSFGFCDNNSILESAYEMLIWVIENGYLKTK